MANKKKNETEETVKKSSTAKKTANTTKQQTKKTTNQQQKKKSTTSSKTESTPKKETVNNNKKEEIKETEKIAENKIEQFVTKKNREALCEAQDKKLKEMKSYIERQRRNSLFGFGANVKISMY